MTVASIDRVQPKELAGEAVLVRIDADNEARLRDALPTLALVSDIGARVVVATHCGVWPEAPRANEIADFR